jgi:hypothetical protein
MNICGIVNDVDTVQSQKVHLPEATRAFQQNEDTLRTNKYTNEKHTMNRQKVTFVD